MVVAPLAISPARVFARDRCRRHRPTMRACSGSGRARIRVGQAGSACPPRPVRKAPGQLNVPRPPGPNSGADFRRIGDHRQVQPENRARSRTAIRGNCARFCSSVSRSVRISRTDSGDSTRTPFTVPSRKKHFDEPQVVVRGLTTARHRHCRTPVARCAAGPSRRAEVCRCRRAGYMVAARRRPSSVTWKAGVNHGLAGCRIRSSSTWSNGFSFDARKPATPTTSVE